ncbi:MAG: hypothetical protein U1A77_02955 [Pirellulales bacterium]
MKSSKGRGKTPSRKTDSPPRVPDQSSDQSSEANGRPSRRRLVILCLVGVVAVALLVYQRATRPNPDALIAEARRLWTRQPVEANLKLEEAIAAAGGRLPRAQVLRCRLLLDHRLVPELTAYVETAGNDLAEDEEGVLELADEAQRLGEPRLAVLLASLIPHDSTRRAEALRRLVEAEQQAGRFDEALRYAHEWAQKEPRKASPRLEAARSLRRQLRLLPAIEECRMAEQLVEPGSEEEHRVLRELVEMLVTARDAAGARAAFDRLVKLTDQQQDLALVEAYVLRFEGRADEALARLDDELRNRPSSVEARFLRGVVLYDAARYRESVQVLKEVVERQPTHKEARYKLAQALQRLGDGEAARPHLEASACLTKLAEERLALQETASRSPPDPVAVRRLAEVCRELGFEQEAAYWQRLSESLATR